MWMYYETDGDSGYYNIKIFRHEESAKEFHEATKNAYGNLTQIGFEEDKTQRVNPPVQELKCPDCEGPMVSRKGQYGSFWGCRKYPDCRGTRDSMGRSKAERAAERDKSEKDTEIPNDPGYSFRRS